MLKLLIINSFNSTPRIKVPCKGSEAQGRVCVENEARSPLESIVATVSDRLRNQDSL